MARENDTKRAFVEDGSKRTHIGGQALIEGVMMRGKYNWAVGVREPDGTLHAEEHLLSRKGTRPSWYQWPVVRGCVAFVDSLVLGYKALDIAANHALLEEEEEAVEPVAATVATSSEPAEPEFEIEPDLDPFEKPEERPFSWKHDFGRPDTMAEALGAQTKLEVVHEPAPAAPAQKPTKSKDDEALSSREMGIAMVLGIVMGVALFIFLPAFATNLVVGDYESSPIAWNLVDGVIRVAIFIFYVWLIGRMEDIKRMFAYHGAEHKTIHCYEHGLPLTPENARTFPRLHVRCGTAFLIMVMIVAILVYTLVPLDVLIEAMGITGTPAFILLLVVRLLLMPVIAGISYEITVKWAGSHPENPLVRVILWPGMQMQRLTTNEPDDEMLECAIAAMQLVIACEERRDGQPA